MAKLQYSGPLTLVLAWYPEDNSEEDWEVLRIVGNKVPEHESALSDVEWLEELIDAVGVDGLFTPAVLAAMRTAAKRSDEDVVKIEGRVRSEMITTIDCADYEETFEIKRIDPGTYPFLCASDDN